MDVPRTARPLTRHVGVEITGVSAGELVEPTEAEDALAALHRYGVVVYRQVRLDDDHLLTLSRMLGQVSIVPTGEHRYPEIQTITLDPARTNALLAAFRRGNFLWHIDGATEAVPQKSTLLTALEVDPAGGDTEFASTYAAYEALPETDKAEIEALRVVHSFAVAQQRANPSASNEERAVWERVPPREHPLVWKRQDGRRSLLLGATASNVVGWTQNESEALLTRLLAWSTHPRFVLRHRWHVGDLVIWDNTGMLHRALPFEATSRRLLHRITLVGDEAVG
jgi:alpha-ketoglutarate-dependent taurine dioxygenase